MMEGILAPSPAGAGAGFEDKEKPLLAEIIERVNDLPEGDLTDAPRVIAERTARHQKTPSRAPRPD